jgi:hypothetical protein
MSNGSNEPVEFTRNDAERLKIIEVKQSESHTKLDNIDKKLDAFLLAHVTKHSELDKRVEENARFRRVVVRVLLWVFTTGTGLGLLAAGTKAMGWLN